MKGFTAVLLLCLLLPAAALAVTEGVVEAAPGVTVELEAPVDALFGAWEEGLADIRAGAAQAASAWKREISELALEHIRLYNSPLDNDADNDRIHVDFRYTTKERKAARLSVEYVRGTGALVSISDTLDGGGELHGGEALPDTQLEEAALHMLAEHYSLSAAVLEEKDDGENAYRWIGCFDAENGRYEVCLDRQTGEAIRVTMMVKEEMP